MRDGWREEGRKEGRETDKGETTLIAWSPLKGGGEDHACGGFL